MEIAIVWIVLIVCSTIVAMGAIAARRSREVRELAPADVLARRYAHGEIDEAEYLTRLSIIKDANELTP